MAKAPREKAPSQRERFIQAAREVGADEDEEKFEQRLKAVAGANSTHRTSPKAVVHDSDCALHNGPALRAGPCDCSVSKVRK